MGRILTDLRRNFVAGILVMLPVVVTVVVLRWIFTRIIIKLMDRVRPAVLRMIPDNVEEALGLESVFLRNILGVVVLILFILLLGLIARNILGRRLIRLGERILARIPIISKIYTTAQQIGQAFLGEKRTSFTRVILFQYPRPGLYTFGLVSGEARGEIQTKTGEKVLNVFVPTTPNPTSGLFILVPEKDAIPIEMTVPDALRLLISGGVVTPDYTKDDSDTGEQLTFKG